MSSRARDFLTFVSEFFTEFHHTGSLFPSGRRLAEAMANPLSCAQKPVRVLEVGPGTGAITRAVVQHIGPEDHFDLIEINPKFAQVLERKFIDDPRFRPAAKNTQIHVCPLEEFEAKAPYDFIISGLPMNNFEPALVESFFNRFFELLAPEGTLSYFEYIALRQVRSKVSTSSERTRFKALNELIDPMLYQHRVRRDWVMLNGPPAWVQHLRHKPTT